MKEQPWKAIPTEDMWRTLPVYTEAEAIAYAEDCAQRWCEAVQRGRRLTREEWRAVNPPNMLRIPEEFWEVVHAVFLQRCGLRADTANVRWGDGYLQWLGRPRTWIEQLEDELRDYDDSLAECMGDDVCRNTKRPSAGPA